MYFTQLFTYVIKDLLDVMVFLPPGILSFAAVNLLCRMAFRNEKAQANYRKFSMISLSIAYLVIILFITFFSREPGSRNGLDLLPFATMGNGPRGDAYVLENVLLFVPFGILLPCTANIWRRLSPCVFTGFLLSVMTEMCQFLAQRGHVQTDDVLTNTLGTIVGYIIFKCGQKLKFLE